MSVQYLATQELNQILLAASPCSSDDQCTFVSLPPTKGIFCCNFGDWAIGASSKAGFVSATSAMGRLVDLPIWSANEQVFVERRIVTIFLVSFAAIPLYEPPTRPVAILGTRAAIQ
jgi:hypothetical protein